MGGESSCRTIQSRSGVVGFPEFGERESPPTVSCLPNCQLSGIVAQDTLGKVILPRLNSWASKGSAHRTAHSGADAWAQCKQ